ncbi:MAG TPA: YfdX family protein [Acidobacteriaceae bacterium]|nr:YfdX family protein [Acidobacteriaceae bacterium]
MRVISAIPRFLLPILLVISAGITAGCNSHPSATQNPPPSNPTPSQPALAAPPGQQQHLNPDVEKQRDGQKQQAQGTLNPDAITAIDDTRKAIDAIASGDKNKAMSAIEEATGKINVLLARNPATALLPVDVTVEVIDVAPLDDKDVKRLIAAAEAAVALHDFPAGRLLLYNLTSELRVRTFNLPLASYPDALKQAARLLDEGKNSDASGILQTALNTLAVVDHVTPVPLILAQAAVETAQKLRQSDKATARALLTAASNQLKRCEELGYISTDSPDYKSLNKEISDLQKQLKGTANTTALFERLKADIAGLLKKLSGKEHR